MTQRIVVRWLYQGGGSFAGPVEVCWGADGRITRLSSSRDRALDVVVFPGLVNAHAHLQLRSRPGLPRDFVPWVRAVMRDQRSRHASDLGRSVEQNARALLREGVTAVGEIDSTGCSVAALARVGATGRCYQEVTGFHLRGAAAGRWIRERDRMTAGRVRPGLSPHAPYSISADLLRAALRSRRYVSIHLAEVADEQELLRRGRGPFRDLLAELGRLPDGWRAPGVGAVEWLAMHDALRPTTQLVHCQHLLRGDAERIAASGAGITVCPGTITWFRRPAPPIERWLRLGIPVSLGTDSAASNTELSMRRELAQAARLWPGLSPVDLLALATEGGARVVGCPGLGRIRRGLPFDAFAVDVAGRSPVDVLQDFVHGQSDAARVWLAGRAVRVPARRR
jgi:cytosine/adenosine deaminase-related metal-dependent hydrolase